MAKKVGILGSTGSIGTQTLEVIRHLNSSIYRNDPIEIVCLSAGKNIRLLEWQAKNFHVKHICVESAADAQVIRKMAGNDIHVTYGLKGLEEIASLDMDILVTAIMGNVGLTPTLAAIRNGTDIALANKETLVAGGEVVMREAGRRGIRILPVDSEHSAIFQCLEKNRNSDSVEKLILTASGGPFRKYTKEQLAGVTVEDALNHPTWKMGGKITVDCATMMNKGLEVIEAKWLFTKELDSIDVVVHPESIIHSMVLYHDGSVIAQLGLPDMKVPIQYALTYPEREYSGTNRLDLAKIGHLTFEAPDIERFPCLGLAFEALKIGGTMPAVMNAANEIAVDQFLKGFIQFTEIPDMIEKTMSRHTTVQQPSLEDILSADSQARETN